MKHNIILVGPMCVGKTTYANELAKIHGLEVIDIDILKHTYIVSRGYDSEHSKKLGEEDGWKAAYEYSESFFKIKDLKSLLSGIDDNSIIQIGGGQIHFTEEDNLFLCEQILKEYPNVILMLPSDDTIITERILSERILARDAPNGRDEEDLLVFNHQLINSDSMRRLSKHIIYTQGKDEQIVIDEIVNIYNNSFVQNRYWFRLIEYWVRTKQRSGLSIPFILGARTLISDYKIDENSVVNLLLEIKNQDTSNVFTIKHCEDIGEYVIGLNDSSNPIDGIEIKDDNNRAITIIAAMNTSVLGKNFQELSMSLTNRYKKCLSEEKYSRNDFKWTGFSNEDLKLIHHLFN